MLPVKADKRFQANFRTRLRHQGAEQVFSYSVLGSFITGDYEGLSVRDQRLNPFGFKATGWSVSQNASNAAFPTSPSVNLPDTDIQTAEQIQNSGANRQ